MFIETYQLFAIGFLILVAGYGLGESHGRKQVKFRINKALDQHDVDVAHGYKDGYSGIGIVAIIRNLL